MTKSTVSATLQLLLSMHSEDIRDLDIYTLDGHATIYFLQYEDPRNCREPGQIYYVAIKDQSRS
jgi:hypothetical protein